MEWDPHKLDHAERLLNHGQPSGPRLDALWEKLKPGVAAAHVPAWRKALKLWWAWAPALATAGVLLVMMPSAFRARGGGGDVALLQASCGAPGHACRVGAPVFLILDAYPPGGEVALLLRSSSGPAWLGDAVPLSPSARVPLEVKVVPDAGDAAAGLTVAVFWSATPMSAQRREAILAGTESLTPLQLLRLDVTP